MPDWYLLAHQSMTDMPYVASIAGAIGLFAYGVRMDDERTIRSTRSRCEERRTASRVAPRGRRGPRVVVPQILYLVSRNLELVLHAAGPHGFRPHLDEFRAGSGLGNCTQPGDPACTAESPVSHFEPAAQAAVWAGLFALFLLVTVRERRAKRLVFVGAWLMAALATMAKGPAASASPWRASASGSRSPAAGARCPARRSARASS